MNIFLGELVGTALLILLGNGAVANVYLSKSKGNGSGWIVVTAGWAFALTVALYVAGWASAGHLNPAVTLGMAIAGKTAWSLVPVYIISQFIGAFIGALLVWGVYYQQFAQTTVAHTKLICFCTSPAVHKPKWNFFTEVIATIILVMGVLGILDMHNDIGSGMGPYAIGILLFAIGLSLGGPTGFAVNPARDLGPRIIYAFFPIQGKGSAEWNYAWIPIVGPLVGGIIGALIHQGLIYPLIPISG
jgi:glycerol uptake facilitator protein